MTLRLLFPFALIVLLTACSESGTTEEDPPVEPPDFSLNDPDGTPFRLSSTEGKVVLLTFFGPWCGACRAEVPVLASLYTKYQSEAFEIVAVAVNTTADKVKEFKAELSIPYRILLDDGVVSRTLYGITYVPTDYLIDRDGYLHGPYSMLGQQKYEQLIEELLPG
jgi:thiol-disulfide isomerase/thioredoxin